MRKLFIKMGMPIVLLLCFFSNGYSQGWSQNNPNYTIYQGGPDLDMIDRPSTICIGAACGSCGQSAGNGSAGTYTTYSHGYTGTVTITGGDKLTANFTGTRTITAATSGTPTTVTFSLSNGIYLCSTGSTSTSVDHTFNVTGQDFSWTSSIGSQCNNESNSINLYNLHSLGSGVTFSGPGVSGNTFNANGLSAGTKTITATRVYDNGTASETLNVIVNAPTTVTFSNPPALCESQSDYNMMDNVSHTGGAFSESAGGLVLTGTGNRFVDMSASSPGVYTVTYTYTNGNGCVSSDVATIDIDTQNVVDAGANQQSCEDNGNLALTAATSGVSWTCVGCSYISGSNFNTNAAPPGVYTVRASKTVGACSDTDDKTVTILAKPTVDAGTNLTVCLDDASFTLSGQSPTSGVWSSDCGSCQSGSTFSPGNAGVGVHTVTFSHTNASGCTNSDTRTITVIGLPDANSINVTGDTRCGAGVVNLSASLSGHTIEWYSSASGGSALTTGNNYNPSIGVGVSTFYVQAINTNTCVSAGRKAVVAEAYAIPSAPTSSDVENCGAGTVTLSASGSGVGAVYDWFENASGGSSLHTGESFTTPSLVTSKTYYVESTSTDGCISANRTPVVAIINSVPGLASIFQDSNCGAGEVTLSVGGAPAGGSYAWYLADTGGSSFNSTSSYTANISVTTSYWVTLVNAEGCEGARREITATIFDAPVAPGVTGDDRCGAGEVTLSMTASNVNTYAWYDTQASSVSLSSSATYSPTVSTTRSYWAEYTDNNGCISPRTEVVATVFDVPVEPTADDVERCGTGTVTLTASGSGVGAVYDWFETSVGGSSLHTGESFTTPSLATSKTYYVEATSADGCVSTGRTAVDGIINSVPGTPLVFDGSSCGAGIVSLSVGGAPAGGSYRWYLADTGGTSFNSTNTYEADITGTTSYWVSIVSAEGCEGAREEIVASINAIPLAPSGTGSSRCGSGQVSLSASAAVSGTFNWYETQASAVILASGSNYTTPIINATTSYWVEIEDANGCVSARTEVVATIDAIPSAPTAAPVDNCGAGMVTLVATGAPSGGIYRWYDNLSGGSPVFTGDTYQPTVTTTRNFYVDVFTLEGCVSDSRTQVTVTINPVPGAPTTFDGETCGSGIVSLSVGGGVSGSVYRWYASSTDPTEFHTGSTYNSTLSETTSYWVSTVSPEGCEGDRAEIVATVNDVPNAPTGIDGDRCGTGNVTIGVTAPIVGVFNWYETEVSAVSLSTNNNFVTPVITETTSFWVDITDANGCVSARTEVVATVFDIPVDPVVDPVERCAAGEITMNASGSGVGAVYNWFESASGGSAVHTGDSYTATVTTTKSFYVSATSADGCESNARTQVVATVNPLPGAPTTFDGETCGAGVVSLSVGGAPAGGSYNWYTTDTGGTPFNTANTYDANVSVTTSYWVSIVSAEGCEGVRAEVIATVNDVPDAPTAVDGSRCGTGTVGLSATATETGTFNWFSSEVSVSSLFTGVNFTTPVIASTTSYWVEFTDLDGCVSPRTEVVATVFDIPVDPVVDPVERCDTGEITMNASGSGVGAVYNWFESSSGGSAVHTGDSYTTTITTSRSFYVSATSADGCESNARTQVVATVNPLPGAPTTFDGETCGAGVVSLSVGGAPAGGSYAWYTTDTGGTPFNSTNTHNANVSVTTSFWVSIVSDDGCEGARAEVIATVNDVPDAPTGIEGSRCGTGTVSLSASATETGTFNWYTSNASVSSLFTGVNFITPSIASTTSYWVEFTDLDGCVSARTEVVATVFDVIPDATVPNVDRCGSGSVTISATSPIGGATFEWYDNAFGGSPIFIGSDYNTPNLAVSRNYYVLVKSPEGCAALNRTPVSVTINPFPSAPLGEDGSICGSGSVDLEASGAPAGGSYAWYTSDTGGSSLSSSAVYTTPSLSTTTSFYVSIINAEGCESNRTEVVATVFDFPAVPTVSDVERCGSGSVLLSGTVGSGTINWYFNASGGSAFATGLNVTVPNVTDNSTYYASAISPEGCESTRVPVNATIIPIENADIGANINLCVNGGGYDLTQDLGDGLNASDGVFVGAGVINGTFFPDIAGIGNHPISFFLTDDIGCLDDGSRFITVISILDGGSEVTLSESEVTWCVNSGLLDLNDYPSKSGGTWTIDASGGSLNVGILDPVQAGVGEYVATYSVDVNGCTVQLQMDVNITAAPEIAEIDVPTFICTGGEAVATITNAVEASNVYFWYQGNETTPFAGGTEVTLTPDATTTYSVQVQNAFSCLSELTTFTLEVSDVEIDFSVSDTQVNERDRVEFVTDVQGTSYEWDFGDGFTSVEQNPSHIYFDAGTFTVSLSVVTNEGCEAELVKADLVTVSEEQQVLGLGDELTGELMVYPQPFNDVIHIDFESTSRGNVAIDLFTLNGTRVNGTSKRMIAGENKLEISGLGELAKGIYLIRLTDDNGNTRLLKLLK